jgi:hypothetical protein
MAKKRSLVDAILTATAASDIFTQDMEDPPSGPEPKTHGKFSPEELEKAHGGQSEPAQTSRPTQTPPEPSKPLKTNRGSNSRPPKTIDVSSQPDPEDNTNQDGVMKWQSFVVPVGPYANQKLGDMPPDDIEAYYTTFKANPKIPAQVYFKQALVMWAKEQALTNKN